MLDKSWLRAELALWALAVSGIVGGVARRKFVGGLEYCETVSSRGAQVRSCPRGEL